MPLGEFIRAKRKTSLGNMWLVSEKIRREKVGSVPTFYCSREQIRLVENGLNARLLKRSFCTKGNLLNLCCTH